MISRGKCDHLAVILPASDLSNGHTQSQVVRLHRETHARRLLHFDNNHVVIGLAHIYPLVRNGSFAPESVTASAAHGAGFSVGGGGAAVHIREQDYQAASA